VYFTDESSARAGEKQEMPADVAAVVEPILRDATFYDLRDPWFESTP